MAAIAALDDDVRRSLYEHVRARGRAGEPRAGRDRGRHLQQARGLPPRQAGRARGAALGVRAGLGATGGPRAAALRAGRGGHRRPGPRAQPRAAGLDPGRGGDHRAAGRARRGRRAAGGRRARRGPGRGRAGPAARRPGGRRARAGHQRGAAGPAGVRAVPGGGFGAAAQLPVPPDGGDGAGAGLRAEPRLPGRGDRGAERRRPGGRRAGAAAGRVLRGAARQPRARRPPRGPRR